MSKSCFSGFAWPGFNRRLRSGGLPRTSSGAAAWSGSSGGGAGMSGSPAPDGMTFCRRHGLALQGLSALPVLFVGRVLRGRLRVHKVGVREVFCFLVFTSSLVHVGRADGCPGSGEIAARRGNKRRESAGRPSAGEYQTGKTYRVWHHVDVRLQPIMPINSHMATLAPARACFAPTVPQTLEELAINQSLVLDLMLRRLLLDGYSSLTALGDG